METGEKKGEGSADYKFCFSAATQVKDGYADHRNCPLKYALEMYRFVISFYLFFVGKS